MRILDLISTFNLRYIERQAQEEQRQRDRKAMFMDKPVFFGPPKKAMQNKSRTPCPRRKKSYCRLADIRAKGYSIKKDDFLTRKEIQRLMAYHGLSVYGLAKKLRLSLWQTSRLVGDPIIPIPIPKPWETPPEKDAFPYINWDEAMERAQWFFEHTQEKI